jgi:hypothetical protein
MTELALPRIHAPHHDERIARIGCDIRRGEVGIFADEDDWTGPDGARRQPVGYVGVLEDGYDFDRAVFSCTRDVAEVIVAAHQREVAAERERHRLNGVPDDLLDVAVACTTTSMTWDGDEIVLDERGLQQDLFAIRRLVPESCYDGRYTIGAYVWPWVPVAAADCDSIIGDWPLTNQ